MSLDDKGLEDLGRAVLEELGDGPAATAGPAQRRAVSELAAGGRGRARLRAWLPALATAAVLTVGLLLAMRPSREVAFWVGAQTAPSRPGAYLRAGDTRVLPVQFESGARLDLAPGATLRVAAASRRLVRVTLLHGAATSTVRNLGGGRWTVEAGPYNVTALGTEFTVHWDPGHGALDVRVAHGTVLVEGAGLGADGLRLQAAMTLHLTGDGAVAITGDGAAATSAGPGAGAPRGAAGAAGAAGAPAAAVPTLAPAPRGEGPPALAGSTVRGEPSVHRAAPATPAPAVAARAAPPLAGWKEAFRRGDHVAAIAEAERLGLPGLWATLPAEELRSLADAARFARRGAVAREALATVRTRFPGTEQARSAAFLLGRVTEELLDDHAGAARWFAVYLAEEPEGPLAEEALGRRIDACRKAGLDREAREAARRYLQEHPSGVFATLASAALR